MVISSEKPADDDIGVGIAAILGDDGSHAGSLRGE